MNVKYISRVESKAEVTLDEVTIDEIIRALAEMVREGMPGTAEVTLRRHPHRDETIISASSITEMMAIPKEAI